MCRFENYRSIVEGTYDWIEHDEEETGWIRVIDYRGENDGCFVGLFHVKDPLETYTFMSLNDYLRKYPKQVIKEDNDEDEDEFTF